MRLSFLLMFKSFDSLLLPLSGTGVNGNALGISGLCSVERFSLSESTTIIVLPLDNSGEKAWRCFNIWNCCGPFDCCSNSRTPPSQGNESVTLFLRHPYTAKSSSGALSLVGNLEVVPDFFRQPFLVL